MNKSSWKQIEADLRLRKAPPPLTDAESFKQDFKARAALMRQEPIEKQAQVSWPLWNWRYAGAALAICLLAGLYFLPSSSSLVTQVKSLQVFAPHSGVIIMTDENNSGTVVWVTDLESGDGSKG